MKAIIILVAILSFLVFAQPSQAADKWTKEDIAWQVGYTALHVIDWGQTRYIARHPWKYDELNPILGKHPSVSKVDKYFAITLVGHTVISHFLPRKYRRIWQHVSVGVEAGVVVRNYNAGIRLEF